MNHLRPSNLVLTYFLLLFILSILLMMRLLWPFASMLVLSYFLASIATPFYDYLHRKVPSSLASLVTCLLIVLLVFLPLIFFVVALSSEAYSLLQITRGTNIAETLTAYVHNNALYIRLENLLESYGFRLEMGQVTSTLSQFGTAAARFIYTQASIWAGNILNFILNFTMMILIIFFILIERKKLVAFLMRLSPLPDNHDQLLMDKFDRIASAILVGNGICGVIQGIFGGLAFAFLDFPSPFSGAVSWASWPFCPLSALVRFWGRRPSISYSRARFFPVSVSPSFTSSSPWGWNTCLSPNWWATRSRCIPSWSFSPSSAVLPSSASWASYTGR